MKDWDDFEIMSTPPTPPPEKTMSDERWFCLMADDDLKLTEQELADGWHFCWDWDGLLTCSKDPDFQCGCPNKQPPQTTP